MPRKRHILLRDFGEASREFTAQGGGSTRHPDRIEDRAAHSRDLMAGLREAQEALPDFAAQQAQSGVPGSKRGCAVRVTARRGQQLVLGSSRSVSRGMKILNTHRRASGNRSVLGSATLFLNRNSLRGLMERLDRYGEFEEPEADFLASAKIELDDEDDPSRPRNFWLFESAASFGVASLQDYWTDIPTNFPAERGAAEWEVWVRQDLAGQFRDALELMGLRTRGRPTSFVDVEVHNVVASRAQLRRLIDATAAVVELRGASDFDADHQDIPADDGGAAVRGLASRVVPAPTEAPWVTLLDTGVNRDNPLLASALPLERCRAIRRRFDPLDPDGHGTKMAGVALFGDLAPLLAGRGPVTLENGLESITVFAPGSPHQVPARDAVRRGIAVAEQTSHPRVFCLSATAVGEAEDGRPTSTSSTLDELAFNEGGEGRLICVAVGNVQASATAPYQVGNYDSLNDEHGIQSPAQALNVLSVGAATLKCSGPSPLAASGDLSPRSRTAQPWDWEERRRCKPDLLMEGGNHSIDPAGDTSRPHGPDMVLTTSRAGPRQPLTITGDTSAAAAAAARLAARVRARYPAMRAETVRGLLVHSAEWTDVMLERHADMLAAGWNAADAWSNILDCFGWGIPDEERLFWSADNALTLIAEDTLRPYRRSGSNLVLKEMKSFRLPWPDDALRRLRGEEVEMRCTLSYFVEPDPHSASLDRFALYPSHRLRFDFLRSGETEGRALSRVNRAVVGSGQGATDDDGWLLGARRARGTLHQDIWRGPATDLLERGFVSVIPTRGWWATNPVGEPAERPVRFSLIMSIRTPRQDIDLFTPVFNGVPAAARVEVPSVVRV